MESGSRGELVWGAGVVLAVETGLTALALVALLYRFWAGALVVFLWICLLLVSERLLSGLEERHGGLEPVRRAWKRFRVVFALVAGYGLGALGLTALIGGVQNLVRGDVLARALLFDVSLVVYMVSAFLPGLMLLLATPSWLVGLVSPWGLRFAFGLAGFLAAAGAAVVVIFGPVYLFTRVLVDNGPPNPGRLDLSAPVLFWALYGLITLVAIATALALSNWQGLQSPARGER